VVPRCSEFSGFKFYIRYLVNFTVQDEFDTQYALVENAGQKLRQLALGPLAPFPGNGFLALEKTLKERRDDAITVARGFAMANPEAAIHMLYEVYPQTRPIGKDEAAAVSDDVKVLRARMAHWDLT
jgi:NitT/TauT family transport system substrate-binding protein